MTATGTQDVTATLNELIQTCIDGRDGFQSASEAIDDPKYKQELGEFSRQRGDFAGRLQGLVAGMGEKPKDDGTLLASAHRGWINLKAAVVDRDTYAVLSECERGEDAAVSTYQRAMESALPAALAATVRDQYVAIRAAHDRVKMLRDAHKPS
jgi:uncharacterized protein (TIGR02284 family)